MSQSCRRAGEGQDRGRPVARGISAGAPKLAQCCNDSKQVLESRAPSENDPFFLPFFVGWAILGVGRTSSKRQLITSSKET